MENSRQVARHELDPRQVLFIRHPGHQVFACEMGEIWITQDASRRDVILGAGQSWQANSHQPVVVSAFKPSVLAIAGAQKESKVMRLCRRLAEPLLSRIQRWRFPPLASFPAHLIR